MDGFVYSDKEDAKSASSSASSAASSASSSATSTSVVSGVARPTGVASAEKCPAKLTYKDLGEKSWKACPVTEKSQGDYGSEPLTTWQLFAWTQGICDDDVPGKKMSECVDVELVGKPDKAADAGAYAYGTTMA